MFTYVTMFTYIIRCCFYFEKDTTTINGILNEIKTTKKENEGLSANSRALNG